MLKYAIKRLILIIPVILGVMLIVFFFQSVSGDDPVDQLLGAGATIEQREAKREELGLNDPIVVQFGRYVWNFFTTGSLGTSYKSGQPVTQELLSRFPVTIKLALISVTLGTLIGIPLGVWAAVKQYTATDSIIISVSVLAQSMPSFWLALLLVSLFAVKLGWVPVSGILDAKGWILPIIVVTFASMAMIIQVTRAAMLETIRQDYIRTAKSKGQTPTNITFHHALRNSMIPILNAVANTLGVQLGGALIVESVFGMPGIGKYAVDAINARNYPAVLGSVVILAITFTIVNLAVDLLYAAVDPRVKTSLVAKGKPRKKVAEEA